jgi:hypothetical protein
MFFYIIKKLHVQIIHYFDLTFILQKYFLFFFMFIET